MKKSTMLILSVAFLALAACEAMNRVANDIDDELGITVDARKEKSLGSRLAASECPSVESVPELTALYQYPDFAAPRRNDLVSKVSISQIESSCLVNEKSVTVDLKMAFTAQLGPQATRTENDRPLFAYPFFVAITGPRDKILAKEVFAASITFDRGETTHNYYEHLRQIIPVDDPREAHRYNVKLGFQLSPEQLAYNRSLLEPVKEAKPAQPEKMNDVKPAAEATINETETAPQPENLPPSAAIPTGNE